MPDFSVFPRAALANYGAATATSGGTVITIPSAPPNQKGAWAEITSGTTYPIYGFTLFLADPAQAAGTNALFDLAVGASGSESVIIENILCATARGPGLAYQFPIYIPFGTRLAMRGQATSADLTYEAVIIANTGEAMGGYALGGRAVTYGANTTTSGGVSIDPGASANTKGSWIEIASTTRQAKSLLIVVGGQANSARTSCSWLMDVAIGASGSEKIILPNLFMTTHTTSDEIAPSVFGPYSVYIPSGTRLAVRAQCSITDATDRTFDAMIYGIE
jgi:hypothetical protein